MRSSLLIFAFILFSIPDLLAQPAVEDFKDIFRLNIYTTTSEITIDGRLEEPDWKTADIGTNFWQKIPFFAEGADPKTEVMLRYDENFIYVAAKCYQDQDVLVQSLVRDNYWDNDGIALIMDPLNTRTNGFIFGVTAKGAQWDALRSLDDINDDWSNKWFSETYQGDGYWSMEMAIPFKILRYKAEIKEWGLNFVRNHMNENEYHNWTAVPESFWPGNPAFAGALVFDQAPSTKKGNFNIIPYVGSTIEKEFDKKTKFKPNAGLDARMSISPTLNLDLTFNPDFSQIEVDRLVTNLTRFNIFLPERRTFFLENSDLFADYGYGSVRPFFSRTIGLDEDRQAVPIVYGMRLTGNLSKSTRLGLMNIHSAGSENTTALNQSAVSVQQFFGRSFIKGLFLNRQGFDGLKRISSEAFSRNTGIEAAYISDDGQISYWGAAHHSWKPNYQNNIGFYTSGFAFKNPNWDMLIAGSLVEENYFTDMGFIARIENYDAVRDTTLRVGFGEAVGNINYTIRPKKGGVTRHNIGLNNQCFLNVDGSLNERIHLAEYYVGFRSTAQFNASLGYTELNLMFPFSFVSDGQALPVDNYAYSYLSSSYDSDNRKVISYSLNGRVGGFYNGSLNQVGSRINFRLKPWINWSLGYERNQFSFPGEFGNEVITAMDSKLEIGFNTKLFWTTLFQYVDQSDYMGINSRIQWRFAPMSDLFIVYVDNYDVLRGMPNRFTQNNNRALILKLNYWY